MRRKSIQVVRQETKFCEVASAGKHSELLIAGETAGKTSRKTPESLKIIISLELVYYGDHYDII